MDCDIIKDLLPLYIDNCCSEESAEEVKKHLDNCSNCKDMCNAMKVSVESFPEVSVPENFKRVKFFGASVIQSALLILSFLCITVGVALEAASPFGDTNGYWAIALIAPATGLLLSLVNWFFLRLYKNKTIFSNISLIATLMLTVLNYVWAIIHYEFLIKDISCIYIGLSITVICCVLSKFLSKMYADMLGKE